MSVNSVPSLQILSSAAHNDHDLEETMTRVVSVFEVEDTKVSPPSSSSTSVHLTGRVRLALKSFLVADAVLVHASHGTNENRRRQLLWERTSLPVVTRTMAPQEYVWDFGIYVDLDDKERDAEEGTRHLDVEVVVERPKGSIGGNIRLDRTIAF
ncbi:hypothetical protein HKX48_003374 [Thoreauomyces humboldtii]|nr:hypothetical protein HKX48_003374 [Thoreauomyces humboldtii]